MNYSTGKHTKFYHRHHVVWVTNSPYKILRGPMRERLREIIRQVCNELGVHIENGVLSKVMPRMKGRSSLQNPARLSRVAKTLLGKRALGSVNISRQPLAI